MGLIFYALVSFTNHKPRSCVRSAIKAPVDDKQVLMKLAGSDAPWFLLDMMEKTGSEIFRATSKYHIVGDYETARKILLDKESVKPTNYRFFKVLFGSDNILTHVQNDQFWHKVRKAVNRSMSSSEVSRMNRICTEHLNKWVKETLEPCIEKDEPFDPAHEMSRIIFKVVTEATFEYVISDEEYETFGHHVSIGLQETLRIAHGGRLRQLYAPLLSEHRNGMKSCSEVQGFARKVLNAYRNNANKSANNTTIKLLEVPGVCVDDTHRIAEISFLLLAGHETAANTISTTLVLLAKHPRIQDKLRSSLLSVDSNSRSKCEFMRHVITESNRLLPVTALGSVREVGRDISCKNGSITIPKGATVYLPQLLLHRNPRVFKDPATFNPERWENATEAMTASVMPFSLGQRNCPGQSLALVEFNSMISKLLTEYSFQLEKEGNIFFHTNMGFVGASLKASKM